MAQALPPPNGAQVITNPGPVVVTTAPPPPFQHPAVTTLAPLGMSVPYAVAPYSFTVHPHPHVSYGGPIHPHAVQLHQPPPSHVQMFLQPPQFQYPPHTNNQPFNGSQPAPYTNMAPGQQPAYPVPSSASSQYQLPPPVQAAYAPGQGSSYGNMPPSGTQQMQPNIQYYGAGE